MDNTKILAATGVIILIFEANKAYAEARPDLDDIRSAPSNDNAMLMRLVDADVTVGIPVLLAGGVASYVMKSWLPVVVAFIAMGAIAGYHHSILSDDGQDNNEG